MVSQDSIATTTDYLSGFQYLDEVLQFFPTAEGYVEPTETGGYQYVYNYTDHLGNNRLSYTFDTTTSSLQIREENNYYPFGLKQKGYNNETINSEYKYKYNGKELQDELGLAWYDYGFRNYDPALGRWFNIDPLGEKYMHLNPYNYAFNNPLRFIDLYGMEGDEPCCPGEGTEDDPIQLEEVELKPVKAKKTKEVQEKSTNTFWGMLFMTDYSSPRNGNRDVFPRSGVNIVGTESTGDIGEGIAMHPEDNIEVPYSLISQLGSWGNLPIKKTKNGMTDAIVIENGVVKKVVDELELLGEGMNSSESVINIASIKVEYETYILWMQSTRNLNTEGHTRTYKGKTNALKAIDSFRSIHKKSEIIIDTIKIY